MNRSDGKRGLEVELPFPPTEYMRLVCGDKPDLREHFDRAGRRIAQALRGLGMLEPRARLLDIGCGCGRVARHLLDSPIEMYAGFDRHPGLIEWAQSHIAARDDRFQFEHVDVQSGYEELESHIGAQVQSGYEKLDSNVGTVSAAQFVFPYDDGVFTGALAASVFTHIDFPATSRYLSETARVLAPSGRVLADFFPDETTGSMGDSGWNFVIRTDDLRRAIEQAALDVLQLSASPARRRHSFFTLEKPAMKTASRD